MKTQLIWVQIESIFNKNKPINQKYTNEPKKKYGDLNKTQYAQVKLWISVWIWLKTFWQDGIWNNLDIKLYLHISSIISGNAQHICNLTHVSWVPKKKIGILFGGGFTAPSATSSI